MAAAGDPVTKTKTFRTPRDPLAIRRGGVADRASI